MTQDVNFFINLSLNIDATASRVPLFERALKTDVLTVLLIYQINYCRLDLQSSMLEGELSEEGSCNEIRILAI